MSAMMNQTASQTGKRINKLAPSLPGFPLYFSLYVVHSCIARRIGKVQRILKYPVQNKRLIKKNSSWTRGGNLLFVQVIKILFTLNDFFVVSCAGYITREYSDPGT